MQSDSWPPKTSNIISYIKDIPPHLLKKMPATIVTGTYISTLFTENHDEAVYLILKESE